MSDPASASASSATMLSGVTLASLISGIDSGILIAAFAGAVIFVLSADDFTLWQKAWLFVVSLVVGIYAARFTASIATSLLSTVLHEPIIAAPPIGALLASAAAVRVLMLFSAKPSDGSSILDRLRGGGRK